jgi:hypothetical protein
MLGFLTSLPFPPICMRELLTPPDRMLVNSYRARWTVGVGDAVSSSG